jgi:hypothetical protein
VFEYQFINMNIDIIKIKQIHFVGSYYIVKITLEPNVRRSISVAQTQQERRQDEVASSLLSTG